MVESGEGREEEKKNEVSFFYRGETSFVGFIFVLIFYPPPEEKLMRAEKQQRESLKPEEDQKKFVQRCG